jgi:CheY-like chemotaxis protein
MSSQPVARILIIDDEPSVRDVFAELLEKRGHVVSIAPNGREAIKLVAAAPVDLVITDIVMPEMDGIELMGQLRRNVPTPAVIAISGNAGQELYLHMAKALGAARVLSKPFRSETLIEAVEELVGPPSRA